MSATVAVVLVAVTLAPTPALRSVLDATFSAPGLPAACVAFDGSRNEPGGPVAYRADEVSVSGGMLRLGLSQRAADGRAYTGGGVDCAGLAASHGRVEFRAKAPAGSLAVATVGALEVALRPGGFHTYTVEWSPQRLRVLVDGRLRDQDLAPSGGSRWPAFALRSGPPTAELLIDRVRVWAYQEMVLALPARTVEPPAVAQPPPVPAPSRAAGWWLYSGLGAAMVLIAAAGHRLGRRVRPRRTALPLGGAGR